MSEPEEGTPELDGESNSPHVARLRESTRTRSSYGIEHVVDTHTGADLSDETVDAETFRWQHAVAQLVLHLLYPLSLTFAERWLGVKPRNQWLTFNRAQRQPGMTSYEVMWQTFLGNLGNILAVLLYMVVLLSFALGDDAELLTSSEVLLACMVHVLRIVMMSVKYGFMPLCLYETITQSDDATEVTQIMIDELLVVWMNPPDSVIRKEIDRAAVERGFQQDEVIQFDTAKFHFADDVSSKRFLEMLGSTCDCTTTAKNPDESNDGTITLRVHDVCFDIYRKCVLETPQGWHATANTAIATFVTALPFFWRADHYGWSNICGRLENPIEMLLIIICAFLVFLFTQTNVRFMLICLYDFQRRRQSLRLCTELIKPKFSLRASFNNPDASTSSGTAAVRSTTAASSTELAQRDDGIDTDLGDPERQELRAEASAQTTTPRRRILTTVRHPPVLDLVDLGTANATGWFVLYDILSLVGQRYQYRCQVLATGNILLLLVGALKMMADIWADKSLELWVSSDPSVSLLPVTFFAYSFANICIVAGCLVLGHQINSQWTYAKLEIRAAQRELAMIQDVCCAASAAKRTQAQHTLQLLSTIAKEMKELNIVRPIKIMAIRADMRLLASVGTALGTVIGLVSQQLANQSTSDAGSL